MVEELCSVINVELLYLQDQRLKNYYVINVKKNMKYTRTTTNDIVVNGHEIVAKDSIVESVIEQLKKRSEVGIKKYNTTLDRNDLSRLEWLQHLQEELFDASLYIEKLKTYERT